MKDRLLTKASGFLLFLIPFSSMQALASPTNIPQEADTSIAGIYLRDVESLKQVLGQNISLAEPDDDFPQINICNDSKTEKLTLIHHYGDIKNSFSEFRVSQIKAGECAKLRKIPDMKHFITGKGIKIGMHKEDLIEKLGKNYEETSNAEELTLRFVINNFENSSFLKQYNLPVYYGEYHFIDEHLYEFSFGFEYP